MQNMNIKLGYIEESKDDIIVNAANKHLYEGGGVCGAIFRKAHDKGLAKECAEIIRARGSLKDGEVAVTGGYNTNAKYIIHAVDPVYVDGNHGERDALYACYINALNETQNLGCRTITFPAISSGIFGYPKHEAWQVAFEAVRDWQQKHDYEVAVTFYVNSQKSKDIADNVLADMN